MIHVTNHVTCIRWTEARLCGRTNWGIGSNTEVSVLGIRSNIEVSVLGIRYNTEVSVLGIGSNTEVSVLGIGSNTEVSVLGIGYNTEVSILGIGYNTEVSVLGIGYNTEVSVLGIGSNIEVSVLGIGSNTEVFWESGPTLKCSGNRVQHWSVLGIGSNTEVSVLQGVYVNVHDWIVWTPRLPPMKLEGTITRSATVLWAYISLSLLSFPGHQSLTTGGNALPVLRRDLF